MTEDKDQRIAELHHRVEALISALIAIRAFRGLPSDVLTEVTRRERAMSDKNEVAD